MDNLRAVLSIVLSKVSPREILQGKIEYDSLSREDFLEVAERCMRNYTRDELENLYSYIENEYDRQSGYMRSTVFIREHRLNVFDPVMLFAKNVLEELNNEPVCQYRHLLRWRMCSHELDESVFTTAFLAYRDIRAVGVNRNFSWRPVIRNNNAELNRLLAQGMADNHFHLKGSAPQFPLSWLSMMNATDNPRFKKLLLEYGRHRLRESSGTDKTEDTLYIAYLKAALIRAYLYARIMQLPFRLGRVDAPADDFRLLLRLLRDDTEIQDYAGRIQQIIQLLKAERQGRTTPLDYALNGPYNHHVGTRNEANQILSGERWLMYEMFRRIYAGTKGMEACFNLFYAYLVLKERIRAELVQTNQSIGFENFLRYQDRKEDFIEGTPFYRHYINMAIKGTLMNQNIVALEARIAPKKTAKENYENIRKMDEILGDNAALQERYFYVMHFIKEPDTQDESLYGESFCRHYTKRKSLRVQAYELVEFREKYRTQARRVRGIDACAKEIGCRPEVFSQVYRYLKNHSMHFTELQWESDQCLKTAGRDRLEQLSLTYHVGEDYLDLVDGLRAIDEAVNFLGLDCGARIGHALALGPEPREYYEVKNNKILLPQQDYLDNVVWMYHKIQEYQLNGYEQVMRYLEAEYEKYFRLIYMNTDSDAFRNKILEAAVAHGRETQKTEQYGAYRNSHMKFSINAYYEAWKLRGDDPECYIHGYYEEKDPDLSVWNRYAVNRDFPDEYENRYNPEYAYLYFSYHYNSRAKLAGKRSAEIYIPPFLYPCIRDIQKGMRRMIAKKGIGVEANPSSNYFIGLFRRYDQQPIFDFYNVGLNTGESDCPPLSVCVNTDDQGVFSTYLENEYGLLALALEKAKNPDGSDKFTRAQILSWIDSVRQKGLALSFRGKTMTELWRKEINHEDLLRIDK